jgi:hypothetical protein
MGPRMPRQDCGGKANGGEIPRLAVSRRPLDRPEIVTRLGQRTMFVLTSNVALEDPAGTVTFAGTAALPLLLESVTTIPPLGAGPLNMTVPVDELPLVTRVGFSVREASAGGTTISLLVWVTPLKEAEMLTEVAVATAEVVTENAPLDAPAGTVTDVGTLATPRLLLDSKTVVPPAAAGPLSDTVPAATFPPVTLEGLRLTEDNEGAGTGGAELRLKKISPSPVATSCDHAV